MRVLAIHAHPDDEVLFTGSTLAAFCASGSDTLLVTATLGEAAELRGPVEDQRALQLAAERREAKLGVSCARLGIQHHAHLGGRCRWRDLGRDATGPGTVAGADKAELGDVMREVVACFAPKLVLTVGPNGVTGHPDHVRIHEVVRSVDAPLVLGACVRRQDVVRARSLLNVLLPHERVGSDCFVGVDGPVVSFPASRAAAAAKRAALDAYSAGLGTLPLRELLAQGYRGRGDTLLLRAVFEVTDWGAEHFVVDG